jgi:hypothetical protein
VRRRIHAHEPIVVHEGTVKIDELRESSVSGPF